VSLTAGGNLALLPQLLDYTGILGSVSDDGFVRGGKELGLEGIL
jgi:hypothetical protein